MNPIVDFLDKRKQKPLKEAKKPVEEIEAEFQIPQWVGSAAQRAGQLSLVSHPAEFSHPDARVTPVLFTGTFAPDGYLRSGNARADVDVVGNAAALDVYAFLSLVLDDGRSVLAHWEEGSATLRALLAVDEATFAQWRALFLQIKAADTNVKTHANVKQVYFPVEQGYHLLSVLYPSGLMSENRERLRTLKFSDSTKVAREAKRKEQFHADGFAELTGLLTVHFGGTKPQNISKLNSNNGGEAWLLPCLPPTLAPQHLRLPKTDFFQWLRWDADLKAILTALHQLLASDYNTVDMRNYRQHRVEQVFDWVMLQAMRLQEQPAGWSQAAGFALPVAQQYWLDTAFSEQRETDDAWRGVIARRISEWMVSTYTRSAKGMKGGAVTLGEIEVKAFQAELLAYARLHEEFIL